MINIEATPLTKLSNIDAGNFSRVKQVRYSAGSEILSRIAKALGVKVDLV